MIKLLRNVVVVMAVLYFSKPVQPKIMQEYVDSMVSEATKFASKYIDKDMLKNAYSLLDLLNPEKQEQQKQNK